MRGLVTSLMVTMVSPPGCLVRLVTITAEVRPRGRVWWSLVVGDTLARVARTAGLCRWWGEGTPGSVQSGEPS